MKKFYKFEDKIIYNAKQIHMDICLDHYFMNYDHIRDIMHMPYIRGNNITKVRVLFAQFYTNEI